ncbi:MAG: metal-dependent hydrolase [Sulfurimonas sp.]|nr:MAG: metal-dependent hydrolase [Sulfurimonas sp.]
MKIITPEYILTPTELKKGLSVAFDQHIKAIDTLENLRRQFPQAEQISCETNSLLMPGLINAHVHLEFSANKTSLHYGDFVPWLHSVIEHRDDLMDSCDTACMQQAVAMMLDSGITTFGAVSSHGLDLEVAANAPQNVVFFNELIGSQANMADALFNDFLARLDASKVVARQGFYPAVAIHSPYSVHPILIKKALQLARNESLRLSAHFMESHSERTWLDSSEGAFKAFFQTLLQQSHALCSANEFLELFRNTPALMTHVVHADACELEQLSKDHHTVIHCPVSNRLLGGGTLDLNALEAHRVDWITATDGLSSNYTLNLFEEMKAALFLHADAALLPLANRLLESVTINAAKALHLNSGAIALGKDADMLLLQLDEAPSEQIALHLILQRYNVNAIFIHGTKVK